MPPNLPVLTIDGGPDDGKTMPIAKPIMRLGRGDENDIVVKSPGVSRHHAEVSISGNSCVLRDLGSTNGTHVNGVDTGGSKRLLRHGDEIRLGTTKVSLVFRTDDTSTVKMRLPQSSAPKPEKQKGPSQQGLKPRERLLTYLESHPEGADWAALESEASLSGQVVVNLVASMMDDGQVRQEGQRFFATKAPEHFCP